MDRLRLQNSLITFMGLLFFISGIVSSLDSIEGIMGWIVISIVLSTIFVTLFSILYSLMYLEKLMIFISLVNAYFRSLLQHTLLSFMLICLRPYLSMIIPFLMMVCCLNLSCCCLNSIKTKRLNLEFLNGNFVQQLNICFFAMFFY